MGEKIVKYFEYAKKHGGGQARMRLAMRTGVSSERAKVLPDNPTILNHIHEMLKEIFNDPQIPKQ